MSLGLVIENIAGSLRPAQADGAAGNALGVNSLGGNAGANALGANALGANANALAAGSAAKAGDAGAASAVSGPKISGPNASGPNAAAEPTSGPARLSPGFSVVVLELLNEQGAVVATIPSAQQLAAYRNGTATPPG